LEQDREVDQERGESGWMKFLRTARNHRLLHTPKEWMNIYIYIYINSMKYIYIC